MSWARLLKRVFDIEHCPNCGGASSLSIPNDLKSLKAACQCKRTAPLALSSTERCDLQAQAHLRSSHRRDPPGKQQWRNSYSTQLRLTGSARWRYISAQKKVGSKFLRFDDN